MASTHKDNKSLKLYAICIVVGAVAIVAGIAGYRAYHLHEEGERLEAEAKAGPHVEVTQAEKSPPERTLMLVGEARPFASVTLYAKVSGYLKAVKVDKGDKVKKDQLLAVIESPEIDKDYQGLMADAKNKKSIAGRMNTLRERNLVSPQEADQANSDSEVAESKLQSLAVQKGYETLRAPFEGTVTARYADAGALVQNAANSQTSALPVVTVSQVDRLRVYVYVDQRDAVYIKLGAPATVKVAERPDLQLNATVTRVSGELDPKTKMLLTEIDVENQTNQLVPGSFVQVTLTIHTPEFLQLPVQALVIQQGKSMVPIVDANDTIHYREVRIGANDGQMMTIMSGLETSEQVALNVGSNLVEGSHVRPNKKEAKPAPATAVTDKKSAPAVTEGAPKSGAAAAEAPPANAPPAGAPAAKAEGK